MRLSEFRARVAGLADRRGPFLTVSLDLSAAGGGRPVAGSVFRTALAAAAEHAPQAAQQLAAELRNPMESAIDAAIADGERGLFVVADAETVLEIDSHLPFRNHVRLGDRPWTFELERQIYLQGRPVVVAGVDRSGVTLSRVAETEVTERRDLDRDEHWTRKTHGRTSQEGRSGDGSGESGHSRSRVENVVEEHRRIDAREAADALHGMVREGDLLVVGGSPEPRSELIEQLPDSVRGAVLPHNPGELPADAQKRLEMVGDLSIRSQLEAGDAQATAILGGAAGEQIARGRTAVETALKAGRVELLVLHEDVVGHWGSADDARHHAPASDDAPYEAMLRAARESSAGIAFARLPQLLEQHEGVAARTRW